MILKKTLICIFIFLFFYNFSCGASKRTSKAEEDGNFAIYIVPILTCLPENAIKPQSNYPPSVFTYCTSNQVTSGLIYNEDNGEEIGSEILASSGFKLQCRTKDDPHALKGGGWYNSPTSSPTPGQVVNLIYSHRAKENIETSFDGTPIRSRPFTQYTQGSIYYCVIGSPSGSVETYIFQKLTIK